MSGSLTLIPTPLSEELPLEPVALALLQKCALDPATMLLVEEHKVARIRWLKWGLPREAIDRFVVFNEHSQEKLVPEIIAGLKSGKNAIISSDGGLPAFCDPGQTLVDACHEKRIRVTATPFPNSIALAIALSGFPHHEFHFAGFLPANGDERKKKLEQLSRAPLGAIVMMDTPYRLKAILSDVQNSPFKNRKIFLATELNSPGETLYRGKIGDVVRELGDKNKLEFILVIAP